MSLSLPDLWKLKTLLNSTISTQVLPIVSAIAFYLLSSSFIFFWISSLSIIFTKCLRFTYALCLSGLILYFRFNFTFVHLFQQAFLKSLNCDLKQFALKNGRYCLLRLKLDCFLQRSLHMDTKIHSRYDNYRLNTFCFLLDNFAWLLNQFWNFNFTLLRNLLEKK